ncbi:MAG: SusC/RagA family TonB-linked outer membrane protein [Prevotella sp.]|jgi:TonB-linked SusC/RagA family outer membrane protein|nr:SusC/RagA family TonB-linked outer membrane protein [Prevotella sp.]
MKIITLFFFLGISLCYANDTYSQTKRLSLNLKNRTIKDAFVEIEKNSEYIFLYHDENLDVKKRVTVDVKDQTIDKVLDALFGNTDNIYFISGKQVFISKSKETLEQLKQQQQAQQTQQQKPEQRFTITGLVTDSDGEPLIGVAVRPKSRGAASVTGANGEFTVFVYTLPETLIFTYVGMKNKEVSVKADKTNYKVVMDYSETELGSVVVEAGIIQRDRMGFTGSYKTTNREELLSIGNMNVLQSLKTLDPSFIITDNNLMGSDPNTLANISVRGGSTMNITSVLDDTSVNPNEPLFILDGFETTLQVVNDLDINRIESITILKDAGSTAIYGSKGGNGVIVIETIKPKSGTVMIDYSGDFQFAAADLSVYNLMNAEEKLEYELLAGRYGKIDDWSGNARRIADYQRHLANVRRGVDTYWLKVPIQSALTQSHSLNVSGGNSDFLYQVGANFKDTQGVMKSSSREAFGGNVRLTYRKNNISISNNVSISITNGHTGAWGSFSDFAKANPYYEMVNADGTIPSDLDHYVNLIENYSDIVASNPYYNAMLTSRNDTKDLSIVNNTAFDWHILPTLRWQASLSLSTTASDGVNFKDPRHTDYNGKDYTQQGEYTGRHSKNWRYNANTTMSYNHTLWTDHSFTAIGRASFQSTSFNSDSYIATGFPKGVEGIPSFAYSYKENTRPGYSETINRQVSFLLALNYNYKYRYLLDFNYNADGTTAFGRNQKFQNFWSAGAGWNVNRESFAKNWGWLKELKVRGSYGINGNQNVDNISTNVYSYYAGSDIFGSASYLSGFANPNLQWQLVKKASVGIDASIEKKLNLTFDVYSTNTDPMVVNIDQKPSSGVTTYPINLGYVDTKGLEFTVSYHIFNDVQKQTMLNVRLTGLTSSSSYGGFEKALANLNAAYTKDDKVSPSQNPNSLIMYRDGASPGALWAVRSLGIDPATGQEVFLTKDGIPTFKYNADDRVVIAERTPKIQGVFGVTFRYKKFLANVNLRYSLGGYNFNSALFSKVENILGSNVIYNQDRRALYDRWKNPGDIAEFKNIEIGTSTPISSRFIQRDNYLRGESAKLSYDFSQDKWIRSLALKDLKVSLSLNDLFTLSTMKQERGIDYPFQRAVSLGVSARF